MRHNPDAIPYLLTISLAFLLLFSGMAAAGSDSPGDEATLLTTKGFDLYDQGRYTDALGSLDQALGLDPYSVRAMYGKGKVLYALRDYSGAVRVLDQATDLSPKEEQAWMVKGDAFVAMGRNDLAINSYQRVTQLNPNNVDARVKLDALTRTSPPPDTRAPITLASSPVPAIPILPVAGVIACLVALVAVWYYGDAITAYLRTRKEPPKP
jgi:tetratricopeptide (TPR) repeat protein